MCSVGKHMIYTNAHHHTRVSRFLSLPRHWIHTHTYARCVSFLHSWRCTNGALLIATGCCMYSLNYSNFILFAATHNHTQIQLSPRMRLLTVSFSHPNHSAKLQIQPMLSLRAYSIRLNFFSFDLFTLVCCMS